MGYLIVAFLCLIAGGAGGYVYGRKVEAKFQQGLATLRASANDLASGAKNAATDLKKGV